MEENGMEVIGMALIVGGMAYLFSGLIFLLPNPTAKRPAIVTENSDEDGCRTGVGVGAHIASQREFDSTTSRDDLC